MAHRFGPSDMAAIPEFLNRNVRSSIDVEDYWRRNDPYNGPCSPTWRPEWADNALLDVNAMRDAVAQFTAGSSSVTFYPHVALLYFSARWRGFLTLESMRDVHRRLAHQLAESLQSPRLIWVPDYFEPGFEIAADDGSLKDIHSSLIAKWGQPQESIDAISSDVVSQCNHFPPRVWYVETRLFSMI